MSYIISADPGAPCTLAFMSPAGQILNVAEKEAVAINFKKSSWQNNHNLMGERMLDWIGETGGDGCVGVVELVGPMPGEGLVSACRFTGSMYLFLGLCVGFGIPVTQVSPQKWKRDLGLRAPKDGNLKELSRQRAISQFPMNTQLFKRKLDHNRAEAILIAWWMLKHGPETGGAIGR